MTLRRVDVVDGGLAVLVATLVDCEVAVDVEEIDRYTQGAGFMHGCIIDSGKFEPTLDGGPSNQWEGERACMVEYQVLGANVAARRAQRDLFLVALGDSLEQDRTLGLPDAQVYAQITEGDEDDVPIGEAGDAGAMSVATATVTILYVAPTAAG